MTKLVNILKETAEEYCAQYKLSAENPEECALAFYQACFIEASKIMVADEVMNKNPGKKMVFSETLAMHFLIASIAELSEKSDQHTEQTVAALDRLRLKHFRHRSPIEQIIEGIHA